MFQPHRLLACQSRQLDHICGACTSTIGTSPGASQAGRKENPKHAMVCVAGLLAIFWETAPFWEVGVPDINGRLGVLYLTLRKTRCV